MSSKRVREIAGMMADHVMLNSPMIRKSAGTHSGLVEYFMPNAEIAVQQEKNHRQQEKVARRLEKQQATVAEQTTTVAEQTALIAGFAQRESKALDILEAQANIREPRFTEFDIKQRTDGMIKKNMRVNGYNPGEDYVPPQWVRDSNGGTPHD